MQKNKKQQAPAQAPIKNKSNSLFLSAGLLVVITFIAFYPALRGGFTNWDDTKYVRDNPEIKSLSLKNIENIFSTFFFGNYHPLTLLSYALDYRFFKLSPSGYHLDNLLLHLFSCLFVFWIFYLVTGKIPLSFIVAVLFAVHPLHVESVAWVSERKDVLYAFFFLASIIPYIYFTRKKETRYYHLSLVLFIMSALSKSMAVTLPVVLLLFDYIMNRPLDRGAIKEKIPFFAVALVFFIISSSALKSAGALANEYSLFTRMLIAGHGFVFYLFKTIIPSGLSCYYSFPASETAKMPALFIISPVIIILLVIGVFYSLKYTKVVLFGSLFYLVTVFPVLQLVSVSRVMCADRYTYVPLTGIFFIFAVFLDYLSSGAVYSGKIKIPVKIVAVIIIITLAVMSNKRAGIWKDSVALWGDAIKSYPGLDLAWNNRGNAYIGKGEYEKGIADCTQALRLNPKSPDAHFNIGNAYLHMNELDRAITEYNLAIELGPVMSGTIYNRGIAYARKKEYAKAVADYTRALSITPDSLNILNDRGNAYFFLGDYNAAIGDYNRMISLNPVSAEGYLSRGNAYYGKKEYDSAISDYTRALSLNSRNTDGFFNRGMAYFDKGDYANAVNDFSTVLAMNPNETEASRYKALALNKLK